MAKSESIKVGKRGTIVLPAALRRQYGFEEGATIIAQPTEEGILLKPAVVLAYERYTRERQAEFLLNNAIGPDEYRRALDEVRGMGLDPDRIAHQRPGG
jgi:bifunctional DNA-binding transcriptional regulator/antitoxin component of YhaV-PrlF toxin-antitoxin module